MTKKVFLIGALMISTSFIFAQNNNHYSSVILRAGVNRMALDSAEVKQLDAIDFQFTYSLPVVGTPYVFINSRVSYNPNYIEFNVISLLGAGCMAMAMKKQEDDIRRIMYLYGVSEERARAMYEVPDDDKLLIIAAGLLAIESASLEFPVAGWLGIEPSWSLLRFKRYTPAYSNFTLTGSAGLNLNICLTSWFLLNVYGEYNWLYTKRDPGIYKGSTYGVRLGFAF